MPGRIYFKYIGLVNFLTTSGLRELILGLEF